MNTIKARRWPHLGGAVGRPVQRRDAPVVDVRHVPRKSGRVQHPGQVRVHRWRRAPDQGLADLYLQQKKN